MPNGNANQSVGQNDEKGSGPLTRTCNRKYNDFMVGEGHMKLKVLGIFFLLSAGLSCATGPGAKQAKVYQNDLATMLGKEKNELIAAITGWNFGLMDSWDAENPGAEMVKTHDRPTIGFAKKEVQDIFAAPGKYSVMVFQKKTGTESATTGQIDQFGRDVLKDTEYTMDHFTIIRAVFRDDHLLNFKVWPDVTSRDVSGLKVMRRGGPPQ
jgi:Neuraminidase (sialidase)